MVPFTGRHHPKSAHQSPAPDLAGQTVVHPARIRLADRSARPAPDYCAKRGRSRCRVGRDSVPLPAGQSPAPEPWDPIPYGLELVHHDSSPGHLASPRRDRISDPGPAGLGRPLDPTGIRSTDRNVVVAVGSCRVGRHAGLTQPRGLRLATQDHPGSHDVPAAPSGGEAPHHRPFVPVSPPWREVRSPCPCPYQNAHAAPCRGPSAWLHRHPDLDSLPFRAVPFPSPFHPAHTTKTASPTKPFGRGGQIVIIPFCRTRFFTISFLLGVPRFRTITSFAVTAFISCLILSAHWARFVSFPVPIAVTLFALNSRPITAWRIVFPAWSVTLGGGHCVQRGQANCQRHDE